ncbi:type 2 lanthipeptide synthetase LanM family protein [Guptibacillus algicola]|uniref:type 2 lanthipeptide synthetase LanM family protein n=1 Tax=Guptibacillus algicola TaxID=225844 RepID=UPI001CD32B5A|nr:type 2 lanthipeptide synthetase LanM family protein [Alkalihalobacillus algicola]MCA0987009.1 type 2 lantipeptide synthetase LanM family protein [Alkalihalobacillus algicola]
MTTKHRLHLDSKFAMHALWIEERHDVIQNNSIQFDNTAALLTKWRDKKNIVTDEAFQMKLNYDCYTEKEFSSATAPIPQEMETYYQEKVEKSEWFKVFNESLELLEKEETPDDSKDWSRSVKPLLLWAVQELKPTFMRLDDFLESGPDILRNLLLNLANELVTFLSRSAVLELHIFKLNEELTGETPEERFESFIEKQFADSDKLLTFYEEYITLCRIVTTRTIFFVNNIKEILNHFEADYNELQDEMGIGDAKIIALKPGMGDTHQKGHTVIRFEFDSGQTVFYKPKNLFVAQSYNNLMQWINNKNELLDMPIYNIICRDTYSWEYNIEKKECVTEKEVSNFYERFGQILGIMYCLKGGDFHYENLIAQGEYPYIIDLETLFQQSPPLNFPDFANIKAKDAHVNSVLFTSLLPQRFYRDLTDKEGIDLSGLNGKEQKLPYQVISPKNFSTDEMVYDYSDVMLTNKDNLPKLDGQAVSFQPYLNEIFQGFKNSAMFFVQHREELFNQGLLTQFKTNIVRVILRATQRYVNMLTEGTHPDYTRDALHREHLMENMWSYPFVTKEVIGHEINDLLLGDIPVFFNYPGSRDLVDGDGNVVSNFFEKSSYELVKDRIMNLNEDEIQTQMSWLKVALGDYDIVQEEKYSNLRVENDVNLLDSSVLIEEAKIIGDSLLESSILSKNEKTMTWLDVTMGRNDSWAIEPLVADFYDGLSGVALFFYYLHEQTGEIKYKKAFDKVSENIKSVPDLANLISSYYGKISVIQLISRTNDSIELLDELLEELENGIEDVEQYDYLSGVAGIIDALLKLVEYENDTRILNITDEYGEKLLTILNEEKENLIGGMAHGSAGISYVFFKLYDRFAKEKYYQAAVDLLEHDRHHYSEQHSAWMDARKDEEVCLHQWCHGSSGIGLSRALMMNYYKDEKFDEEINVATENVLKQGIKTDDGICHGNLGDMELFLTLYQNTKDPNYLKMAHGITQKVLARKSENSNYSLRDIPGFDAVGLFTGKAGVGYQLLRLANPDSVPSVQY